MRVHVTHNDEPIDSFNVVQAFDERDRPTVQKMWDEIDYVDSGIYIITVDIGRNQLVHKLSVSVGAYHNCSLKENFRLVEVIFYRILLDHTHPKRRSLKQVSSLINEQNCLCSLILLSNCA